MVKNTSNMNAIKYMTNKENNILFEKIKNHFGHSIHSYGYGLGGSEVFTNVVVECLDCNEVLIDIEYK